MNPSQTKSMRHRQKRWERRRLLRLEKVASTISLPDDLIKEVLSFLPVKSLTRLRCVTKSFNSFISDPYFIQMHLNQSSRNTNPTFLHITTHLWTKYGEIPEYLSFTVFRMLDNPPTIINLYDYDSLNDYGMDSYRKHRYLIDSCNGLLCFFYHSYGKVWFRFWNPATRTISDKLGFCNDNLGFRFNYTFGYDSSKDTFKLVRFFPETAEVRVFSLNDNVWRYIQNSPVAHRHRPKKMKVVHFNDSLNWLVICNYSGDDRDVDYVDYYNRNHDDDTYAYKDISIEQFVIISLDLRTETHTKLLPPQGFNEVPCLMPSLSVLNDCICFSHDFKQTHFIIWQMKEFGVEESWTQFLKISYHHLQINGDLSLSLFPLCLSEKNDTLLLTKSQESGALLYNWRDNRARRIDNPYWLFDYVYDKDYVESLVSYH